jgi:hypothetical protein
MGTDQPHDLGRELNFSDSQFLELKTKEIYRIIFYIFLVFVVDLIYRIKLYISVCTTQWHSSKQGFTQDLLIMSFLGCQLSSFALPYKL